MAKGKKQTLTLEERLEQALVPVSEQPYEVPKNWVWTKLINGYCECLDNFRKPINANERSKREGNIPYYGATGQVGWIDNFLTDEHLVLIGEDGAPFFDIIRDKAYVITGKAWVNNHAHILKSYFSITGNIFLTHYLNIFDYRGFVNGTTRLKLTQSSMNEMLIPLPPLQEQKRIVERIESLFEKLDRAKELVQSALDSFETRKAAILHKAFTGELTKKWREENKIEQNCFLENLQNELSSLSKKDKINVESELSKISKNRYVDSWINCTIGSIGIVSNGSTPSRKNSMYWNGEIHWISSGEVRNNIIFNTKEKITLEGLNNSSVKLLPIDTVLIAMIGEGKTRGQCGITKIEATTNQNIASVVPFVSITTSKFLWYWFQKNYEENRKLGNGSGQQALNCKKVRELPFVLPTLPEQKEIVRILDNVLEKDFKAQELCDIIEKIDLMKKAILARAFRGELGTNDPAEESAVELLKQVLEQSQ